MKCISSRTCSGMSSRSFSLRFGRMIVLMPARCAPEHLLLDAADRQHLAAQRDLAGHRHVVAHRPSGEQRRQRGRDGDAGGRAVLRHRAGGHVDVQVEVLEEVGGDAEALGARAHVAQRRLRRLLHHLAELAGERQALLAAHLGRLDEQDVAAHRRPRQPDGDAGFVGALGDLGEEAFRAEKLVHLGRDRW